MTYNYYFELFPYFHSRINIIKIKEIKVVGHSTCILCSGTNNFYVKMVNAELLNDFLVASDEFKIYFYSH